MKPNRPNTFRAAVCLLGAFVLWTAVLRHTDVQPIGPLGSAVGLASVNRFVHSLTGVHMALYTLTDWLGLIPLGIRLAFALQGLCQWIRRKRLLAVDPGILLLGGFYLLLMGIYALFEMYPVNYRPVLIGGVPEASYPSSTTLLVLSVIPTAGMRLDARFPDLPGRRWIHRMEIGYLVFTVLCRLLSGVHWFTDILGGILLSGGLVMLYRAAASLLPPEF